MKYYDELKKVVTVKLTEKLLSFFSSPFWKQATGCSCGTQFRIIFPNNGTAAMLVSPTSPLGIELYSYANAFFSFGWKRCSLITWVKTLCWCWIFMSEVNYDTCLALARFHLLVNAHFPSPFWKKKWIQLNYAYLKMTKDAISFLGHRNTTQIKTPCHWTG